MKEYKPMKNTVNQEVTLEQELKDFKKRVLDKYKVELHTYVRNSKILRPSHEQIEKACLLALYSLSPEHKDVKTLRVGVKNRPIVIMRQIFAYMSVNDFGYGVTETSRYLVKNHATVVHSIKACNNYIFTKDKLFKKSINQVKLHLGKYVGTIPENISGEDNSQSNASTLWDEGKNPNWLIEV